MHLRHLWIACGLLATLAVEAAVVYKWTDAAGVVHFSDQAVPGAQKIVTSANGSNGITGGPASPPPSAALPPKPPAQGMNFTQLSIASPSAEQVFFGDQVVSVSLQTEPGLQPGQNVTWHLNGKALDDQPPQATSITLQTLDRGTYSVAATVTDTKTGQSQSTDSVTFYVRQPSELSLQHRKPGT